MSESFGKDCRLLKRSEFERVFQAPDKRSSDRYFIILGRCRSGRSRLGLAVAKRNVQRAHERNRLKRLARESFRQYPNPMGYDTVLLVKHQAQFVSNAVLLQSLQYHWDRIFTCDDC